MGIDRRAVLGGALTVPVATMSGGGPAVATGRPSAVDRLVALRRDLYAHPEGPGQERRTAAVVAGILRGAGLEVTTGVGGHGVVAVLTGTRPGRTVAYRADMDAVPPGDQIGGRTEPAHLCGHDIHTTVGVGVALALARQRERLAGRVVFVFQPAEEALTGAAAMLADGVLTTHRPAEIHALHCWPAPVGSLVVTSGFGLPGRDQGIVTLTDPESATRLAADLNGMSTVARPATPADLERLVAGVETPRGPLAGFVFLQAQASGNRVRVVSRCWPEQGYPSIRQEIRRRAQALGAVSVDFPADPFPAMVTPQGLGDELERHLRRTVGDHRIGALHAAIPFSGEDFSLFLKEIPGTYTLLGVRSPGAPIEAAYPHFGTFVPDERAIGHGVRAMTGWLAARTVLARGGS
ncbi:M20 metallopeptidase family protein [Actinoplanes couchii]|uniref:Hydrolase n=1 Tax=Actinoplanes couchii TaxID=403638 RepID=A0ABQ3XHH0_9ACTN|nr:M20/M25/M40 family metallo-hydrolase [Actinoplanes couchii]MDR6317553.1 metal-dependent amidase/aminoacylase/carboxypeptidase family protein [Actinoplanes couchii]GID57936.1 hydrolase [Actinoplanes couchii]